jgi:hypothetical protein
MISEIGCLCPCHRGLRVWYCSEPCSHQPAPVLVAHMASIFQAGSHLAMATVRDWAAARARLGHEEKL